MTSVSTPYMLLQFVVLSSASMMACLAQKDASSNIIRNIRGGVRDAGWSKEGVRAGEDNEDFDYYVYSMCSLPDYCKENDGRFPGCHVFDASWEGNLTIHGLWPNNNDGTYISTCTTERLDPSVMETIHEELSKEWPNVHAPSPTDPGHFDLYAHEWSKYGTCSGLTQSEYFIAALGLLMPTPTVVKKSYGSGGGEVTRQELEAGYGSTAVFLCNSGYLSEVRVCFERKAKEDGVGVDVGDRIQCPDSMLEQDSCGETVNIASFIKMTADKVILMNE